MTDRLTDEQLRAKLASTSSSPKGQAMSPYDELRERCNRVALNAVCGRKSLPVAFVRDCEVKAILAEVFRTLETVTPEMRAAWFGSADAATVMWHSMLHASPLAPPKKSGR